MGPRPLLLAAALASLGALLGVQGETAAALGAGWALAALGAAGLCTARARAAGICALALAAGLLRGGASPRPAEDPELFAWLDDPASAVRGREPLQVEGEVLWTDPAPGGARLLVRLDAREARPGRPLAPAPAGLLAELRGPPGLHRGDRLQALVKLRRPLPPLNPGARDVRGALAVRGVALQGTVDPLGLRVLARGPAAYRWVDEARARFAARCAEVCTSPRRAALVAALGAGDRSGLDPALDEELSESGLVHLLASAGLHLWVTAWAVLVPLRWLLLRLPGAGRRRAAAGAALAALPAVAAQTLLLGAPWPAWRAAAAASLRLGGMAGARRADPITSLGASVALCALVHPPATCDLALQLSVAGVLGILLVAPRLRALLGPAAAPRPGARRPARRLWAWGAGLLAATAGAALASLPLLLAAFHRAPLGALLGGALGMAPGLLAIPLASAALPAHLAAPGLALPLFWAADHLAGAVEALAGAVAALPFAVVRAPAPGPLESGLWWLALLLLCGLPGPLARRPGALLRAPAARLARAAAPLILLALLAAGRAAARDPGGAIEVHFLAAGQGDAALVRLPDGAAILVDAGGDLRGPPPPWGPGNDVAARVLLPALAELGVSRLDLAVLTHPHPDHAGGFFGLLGKLPVDELWSTGEPGPGGLGDRLRARAREAGVPARVPPAGLRLRRGGAEVEVLAPDPAWAPDRSTNDNSLVLRVSFGEVALLFAGDAEALEEAQLAHGARPVRAQLLKAGHHGSRTSTSAPFLRAVAPAHAVLSLGPSNPFGFPHAEVLERLHAAGARVWRTDRGAVRAWTDGRVLRVEQAAVAGSGAQRAAGAAAAPAR